MATCIMEGSRILDPRSIGQRYGQPSIYDTTTMTTKKNIWTHIYRSICFLTLEIVGQIDRLFIRKSSMT